MNRIIRVTLIILINRIILIRFIIRINLIRGGNKRRCVGCEIRHSAISFAVIFAGVGAVGTFNFNFNGGDDGG